MFLHDEKMYCLCGESLARLLSMSRRKEGDEVDCHEYGIGIGRSWDLWEIELAGQDFRQGCSNCTEKQRCNKARIVSRDFLALPQ